MKNWKKNFLLELRRSQGQREIRFASQCIFIVAKTTFSQHLDFLFSIKIGFVIPKEEFGKETFRRGIKLIFQMWMQKIWLICDFLFQVGERTCDSFWGHAVDTWIKTCTKYGQPFDFVHGIVGHVPVPRTCPGHVWDISN